ncbi:MULTISPECIES: MFS transporter [Sporosarcina]|uniref:MFS transporter n=1 Tax=Sporosarcina TaxID=1569 RepID=UPI00078B5E5C|nr:MFS transporter [Sporosarcina psychrophila]AMQ04928.1 3-phosphoglycerate kinase [Sporosarcina psychrophila]
MKNQRWLSMSFFAFFFTWGVFLPYWTGWLTIEKGLSVTAASFIMGAGMIARSLSTFLIFPYLTRKISMIRVMKWISLTALILTLLYLPDSPFIVLLIITVLFSAIYPMILPAVESGASILMQIEGIHYGKSRSFGSIGYTIALLLIGAATAIWTEQAILYIMIVGLTILTLFFMRPAPKALQLNPVHDDTTKQAINFKSLLTSKEFAIILLLAILLQGAHASYYNFGFIFLDNLGVNGLYIGIILNIAVLFEILFFTRADRLLANLKVSTMFLIAGIGSTVRWILIALFPYISVFIGTQILHALSFGVAHFAFIKFISQKLPHDQLATAQGMYAAFAMSLSTAILTFLGGYLYDVSPRLAFLGMIICSIPAIIIVLMTRKKYAY